MTAYKFISGYYEDTEEEKNREHERAFNRHV